MKSPLKSNVNFRSLSAVNGKLEPKSNISSFLLYDGNLEIGLSRSGHTVVAHTNRKAIYEFWALLLKDSETLGASVANLFPTLQPHQFPMLQETWFMTRTALGRATLFFILNNCSSTGYVSQGTIERDRFNPVGLSRLKNFKVERLYPYYDDCEDAFEGLSRATHTDYIIIPAGNYSMNLFEYGKNRGHDTTLVHHRNLCERMKEIDRKWLLIYKKHPSLFTLYNNYDITMVDAYGKPTAQKNRCEEMIIANF